MPPVQFDEYCQQAHRTSPDMGKVRNRLREDPQDFHATLGLLLTLTGSIGHIKAAVYYGRDTTDDEVQFHPCPRLETMTDLQLRRLHGVLGLISEAVEIYNEIIVPDSDEEKIDKEIGDVCWYLAELLRDNSTPASEIFRKNIDKLRKRYPEGFSTDRANNRSEEEG